MGKLNLIWQLTLLPNPCLKKKNIIKVFSFNSNKKHTLIIITLQKKYSSTEDLGERTSLQPICCFL